MALCVQAYLKMDRPDQAEKAVKAMSAHDDDATLTQLATAWVDIYLVGAGAGGQGQGQGCSGGSGGVPVPLGVACCRQRGAAAGGHAGRGNRVE